MESELRTRLLIVAVLTTAGSTACGVTASDASISPESGHESGTDAGASMDSDTAVVDASDSDVWSPPSDAACCPALDEPAFDWNMLTPACEGLGCQAGRAYWCTSERGEVAMDAAFPGCFVYTSVTSCSEGVIANWICDTQLCSGCVYGAVFVGDDFATLCALVSSGVITSSDCGETI
jgi:hypothetical protein